MGTPQNIGARLKRTPPAQHKNLLQLELIRAGNFEEFARHELKMMTTEVQNRAAKTDAVAAAAREFGMSRRAIAGLLRINVYLLAERLGWETEDLRAEDEERALGRQAAKAVERAHQNERHA